MGNVIRYAGDEFIVLINSHKQVVVDACLEEIERCINKFNDSKIAEYKLSASKGYAMYMPKTQSVDDFMNIIDQKMYESKKRYHNMD
jgi:diguanylate cyclase (GGDEF)-like protein